MQVSEILAGGATIGSYTIGTKVNHYSTIGSSLVSKTLNPIQTASCTNDDKTVDKLLEICSDLIDSRYKPWFAKRFYKLNRDSVISAASLARQDGKYPQRYFSLMVREAV